MALDPALRSYLELREWAYGARRKAIELQATYDHNEGAIAQRQRLRPNDPDLPGYVEHHARVAENLRQFVPNNRRVIEAIDAARLISFPHASVDDYEAAWKAVENLPGMPDPFELLPFPVCYIGFGEGVVIPEDKAGDAAVQFLREREGNRMVSTGLLASRAGHLWSISCWDGPGRETMAAEVYEFGECDPHSTPFGWLLYLYLAAMEHHAPARARTDVSSLSARRLVGKAVKVGAPRRLPPDFYEVRIERERFRGIVREVTTDPREWSHRWDVRQHHRARFLRGTGEVPPETAALFMERGYEVHFAPGDDVRAELAARGLPPPGEGEWIATKRWKVRDHIKGPDSKPYVPAVRVSSATFR
jgi:hypothetical protein